MSSIKSKRIGKSRVETSGDRYARPSSKTTTTPVRGSTSPMRSTKKKAKNDYFDVDGDPSRTIYSKYTEDTVESSESSVLTWRGTPEFTGAQVPIVVVVANQRDTSTYHIHREVLLSGNNRQCKYFVNVLQRKEARAAKSRTPRLQVPSINIELNAQDAKNFPVLLDFMYSASQQFDVKFSQCIHRRQDETNASYATPERYGTTISLSSLTSASSHSLLNLKSIASEDSDDAASYQSVLRDTLKTSNAVSLRSLALQFDNPSMLRAVNSFIQKDLSLRTVSKYMSKAAEYNDERLLDSAKRLFLDNFEQINKKSFTRMPLPLFRALVHSFESLDGDENSRHSQQLSIIVCNYLEKHPEEQSAALLLELTDTLVMPQIAPDAAMGFTAMVKCLDPRDAMVHWPSLARLCQRCAREVVHEYGWQDFSVDAALQEHLGKLNSNNNNTEHSQTSNIDASAIESLLFATSYAAALEQAQDDYEEVSTAHEELDSMVSLLDQSASQWEALSQSQDKYIDKQKKALVDARDEISSLRRQLADSQKQNLPQERQQKPIRTTPSVPPKSSQKRAAMTTQTNSPHLPPKSAQKRDPIILEEREPPLDVLETDDTMSTKNLISPAQLGHLHALRLRRRQELQLRKNRRRSSIRTNTGVL